MIADTKIFLIRNYGPPPWSEIEGQQACKYASLEFAEKIAAPWIWVLIKAMCETLSADCTRPLIDIRWWRALQVGDIPGVPGWHYDCFNAPEDPRSVGEEHRLYFAGAGCRTRFCPDYQPPEGWIIGYGHNAKHEITAATLPGPRLLVRASKASVRIMNESREPYIFRRAIYADR